MQGILMSRARGVTYIFGYNSAHDLFARALRALSFKACRTLLAIFKGDESAHPLHYAYGGSTEGTYYAGLRCFGTKVLYEAHPIMLNCDGIKTLFSHEMEVPDEAHRNQKKRLKFSPDLVPLVLSGEKTSTWRIRDEKEITRGDILQLLRDTTKDDETSGIADESPFAVAEVVDVTVKPFKAFGEDDLTGHERFRSVYEMIETYRGYYPGANISLNTSVKIIRFELRSG